MNEITKKRIKLLANILFFIASICGIIMVFSSIYLRNPDLTIIGLLMLIASHLNDIENKLDKRTKEDLVSKEIEHVSDRVLKAAHKVLHNPNTSKAAKTANGSALSQRVVKSPARRGSISQAKIRDAVRAAAKSRNE